MNQKDKVLNLFGFLMDLIEEPQETKEETKEIKEDVKLQNTKLPHHPLLNPYLTPTGQSTLDGLRAEDNRKTSEKISKLKSVVPRSLELIKQMDIIDKEHADEVMKSRIVTKAVKPLISEIEELKAKANEGALEDKKKEELETIVGEVGAKLGITLENGKVKLVNVPTELRDNIPLTDIGITTSKDEIKESLKNSKLPETIKEAIINSPSEQPIKSAVKKKKTKKTTKVKK